MTASAIRPARAFDLSPAVQRNSFSVDRRGVPTPIGVATSWLVLLWQGQSSVLDHNLSNEMAIGVRRTDDVGAAMEVENGRAG
jgi:hypothetical protein